MADEIRVALAAETVQQQTMMELYCRRDESLRVVSRPRSLQMAMVENAKKQLDVFVIWAENDDDGAMSLFRSILATMHTSVVMISNNTVLIVEAIKNGVADFITYSAAPDDEMRNKTAMKLPGVIHGVYTKFAKKSTLQTAAAQIQQLSLQTRFNGIIALGASAGGTEATSVVLRQLPANMPGMVIVQHIPPVFSAKFAERLDAECAMKVREARDWDVIEQGTALVAPGDRQMSVVRKANGFAVRVQVGERVSGHCPSVNVLFSSVAKEAGHNAVGIILTGMGDDGATGLVQMRKAGAYTLGQDEKTSMVYGMPRVAYELGGVCKQGAINMLPKMLIQYLATK